MDGVLKKLIFWIVFFVVSTVCYDFDTDRSLYCEDLVKVTNLCNDIFTKLACPKTCGDHAVQKECGRTIFGRTERGRKREHQDQRFRRVVGGNESSHGEWPWHVSLYYKGSIKCSGSIISKNWILTAANCFDEEITSYNPSDWTVSAGSFRIGSTERSEVSRNVKAIVKHENNFKFWKIGYKDYPDDYDVALLKIEPLGLNDYKSPICLPESQHSIEHFSSTECRIVGWGNKNLTYHDKLQKSSVKIVGRDVCNLPLSYDGKIHQRAFCGGFGSKDSDACAPDAGGALSCKFNDEWIAVGLVSWGYKCGRPDDYGVYTNIPYLRSWIVETLLGYDELMGQPNDIHEKVKRETAHYPKVPASERKTYLEKN